MTAATGGNYAISSHGDAAAVPAAKLTVQSVSEENKRMNTHAKRKQKNIPKNNSIMLTIFGSNKVITMIINAQA